MGKDNFRTGSRGNLTYRIAKGSVPWNKGLKYTFGEREARLTKMCARQKCRVAISGTAAELSNKSFCSRSCASYIAGHVGATHTPEAKLKMRKAKLGKHLSPATEFKRDPDTPEKLYIRHSAEYKLWRKEVFERDDYTCQICGLRGGVLHADHIKPFAIFPELRLEVSNGRTLCKPCHEATPTFGASIHVLRKMYEVAA
jgi:5-methylcytosine-specific restriction endonuclease McrA